LAATFAAPRPKPRPALIAVAQSNAGCVALHVAILQMNDAGEMLIWQRERPRIWFEDRAAISADYVRQVKKAAN